MFWRPAGGRTFKTMKQDYLAVQIDRATEEYSAFEQNNDTQDSGWTTSKISGRCRRMDHSEVL
jgi:hypothetical protein